MSALTVLLPDSVSESEAKLLLAFKLYEVGRLSSGQAAQLSGYSKRTFLELLNRYGVPVFDQPPEDLVDDLSHA